MPLETAETPQPPSDWELRQLDEVVSKLWAGPSPASEKRTIREDEWGVLRTTAITWDGWDEREHKVLPREYWGDFDREVQKDDVLITKAGPRHRVGVVVQVDTVAERLIVSGKMVGLRADPSEILPEILAGALSMPRAQRYLNDRTTGMAESQVNFTHRDLKSTPLIIPPLPEQRRIAHVLDTADAAIRRTEAVIDKLEQVKHGLLHDLLTRGLDEEGRLRPPPEEARHLYTTSRFGSIPREWDALPMEDICRRISVGIVVRPTEFYSEDGNVPMLRSANVRPEGIDPSDLVFTTSEQSLESTKSMVTEGDLVTVRTGYPGTTAVVPPEFDGAQCIDLILATPGDKVLSEYLAIWINSDNGKGQVLRRQGGLAQQHFNVGEMKDLIVGLPSSAEQERIATAVDQIDQRIVSERRTRSKLSSLKSGLMQDLLTGRVRVPESVDGGSAKA